MADVTGPIRSLPNSLHALPEGAMCDLHPKRKAVARVQGETDSFGCEMNDMCAGCLKAHRAFRRTEDTSGVCDWCKQPAPKRFDRRDIDEGLSGRVYQVCRACIERDEKALAEELARYDDEFDCGD